MIYVTHDQVDLRRIAELRATVVNVSEKSNWIFVELQLDDGATGTGEATLHGYEPLVTTCLEAHPGSPMP